ncbi:MAG: hypothetical protein BWY57_02432 [Betaproteobacteria bacterium ADurb.Bin341]|nr:MAG: hypothetical protein BWY57_02432 [Betaproteobacteria bacterium ADurb.Bin341]
MLKKLSRPGGASGFTLVELMIAVVVLAILVALALPSFRTWLTNIQIRNAASSVLAGIQRARAEAVGRNATVSFVMAADSSWTVNVGSPATVIETRSASEGSQNVTRTVLPVGATTITFNNLGVVVPNSDGTASLSQLDFAASGGDRDMRITIGVGGNARMCDPSLPAGSSPGAC